MVAAREEFGRQLVDVKTVLSEGIAKNSGELAELRKKGERDYFEFDIRYFDSFGVPSEIACTDRCDGRVVARITFEN